MRGTGGRRDVGLWICAGALVGAAIVAAPAAGKGIDIRLSAQPDAPRVGEAVAVRVRARHTLPGMTACPAMRVVVVAPGVAPRRALASLEGGVVPRRIGAWGAFRLDSLRRAGPMGWRGVLRPHRPGRWTLIVPNACGAGGYRLPLGWERIHLSVRP